MGRMARLPIVIHASPTAASRPEKVKTKGRLVRPFVLRSGSLTYEAPSVFWVLNCFCANGTSMVVIPLTRAMGPWLQRRNNEVHQDHRPDGHRRDGAYG